MQQAQLSQQQPWQQSIQRCIAAGCTGRKAGGEREGWGRGEKQQTRIDLFEQPWQQSIQRCIAVHGSRGRVGSRRGGASDAVRLRQRHLLVGQRVRGDGRKGRGVACMRLYRRIDLFEQPWQQSIQRCIAAGCRGMKGVRLEGLKGVGGEVM